jgi:hypothetical protein
VSLWTARRGEWSQKGQKKPTQPEVAVCPLLVMWTCLQVRPRRCFHAHSSTMHGIVERNAKWASQTCPHGFVENSAKRATQFRPRSRVVDKCAMQYTQFHPQWNSSWTKMRGQPCSFIHIDAMWTKMQCSFVRVFRSFVEALIVIGDPCFKFEKYADNDAWNPRKI